MTNPISSNKDKPLDPESQTSSSSETEEKTDEVRKKMFQEKISDNRNYVFWGVCLMIFCCPIAAIAAACFGCFRLTETFGPTCCDIALDVGPAIAGAAAPAAEGCGACCMGCLKCLGAMGECLDN